MNLVTNEQPQKDAKHNPLTNGPEHNSANMEPGMLQITMWQSRATLEMVRAKEQTKINTCCLTKQYVLLAVVAYIVKLLLLSSHMLLDRS